jgi:hypothetical protein
MNIDMNKNSRRRYFMIFEMPKSYSDYQDLSRDQCHVAKLNWVPEKNLARGR